MEDEILVPTFAPRAISTFREAVPISQVAKENWPDLKMEVLGVVCGANKGRSVIAEVYVKNAIQEGLFPPVRLFSGALVYKRDRPLVDLSDVRVVNELNRRDINTWGLQSKNLFFGSPAESIDLFCFVEPHELSSYLPDLLTRISIPRSIICIPLRDPSVPPMGSTIEEEISKTCDWMGSFIPDKLLGILYNVRMEFYRPHDDGVIYPYGNPPIKREKISAFW